MEYNMAPAFDTLGTALLQGLSFVPFAALKPARKKAKHLIQNHVWLGEIGLHAQNIITILGSIIGERSLTI